MIDLFAGIGSISLEALSRGAQHVISVEMHGSTIAWLKKITYELGAGSRSEIVRSEAMKWLKQYTGTADFIFADPPYAYENYQELIDLVLHHPAFNHALFVLEHRKSTRFTEHPNFAEERTYGEVRFTYFKH
jgi:16S rRNA (guanine966-N2)-methyltransferase